MSHCSACAVEYTEASLAACPHCGALLDDGPLRSFDDPVVVLEAGSVTEAQVAEATLEAEGIPAYVSAPSSLVPNVDVDGDEPLELDVYVAAGDIEAAAAILSASPLTEEELTEVEESNPAAPPEPN